MWNNFDRVLTRYNIDGVTAPLLLLDCLRGDGKILTVVGVVQFTTALPDHL